MTASPWRLVSSEQMRRPLVPAVVLVFVTSGCGNVCTGPKDSSILLGDETPCHGCTVDFGSVDVGLSQTLELLTQVGCGDYALQAAFVDADPENTPFHVTAQQEAPHPRPGGFVCVAFTPTEPGPAAIDLVVPGTRPPGTNELFQLRARLHGEGVPLP